LERHGIVVEEAVVVVVVAVLVHDVAAIDTLRLGASAHFSEDQTRRRWFDGEQSI